MTVNTSANKVTYLADSATTVWSFPFPGVDPAFIQVIVVAPDFSEITVPPGTYSVTLDPPINPNPTSQGGYVTFPLSGAPVPAGYQLTIVRTLPAIQSVSLSNQSIIYPPVIEAEFDYLTLLAQGQGEEFLRSFRVGPQDPPPAVVPVVALRANQAAFFDSQGNLTPGTVPGGGVFISAVMIPVVEAATLQLARDNMGITAAIAAAGSFTTGDLKPTHKAEADPGWIMWIEGTIGDFGSGATILNDPITIALFTLYFSNCTDDMCPMFLNDGSPTDRTTWGTPLDAFNNQTQMSLPKGPGRALSVAGFGGGLTGRFLGETAGAELETPTEAKTAIHRHTSNAGAEFIVVPVGPAPALWHQLIDDPGGDNAYLDAVGFTGSSESLNILGPSTYVNVMIKL